MDQNILTHEIYKYVHTPNLVAYTTAFRLDPALFQERVKCWNEWLQAKNSSERLKVACVYNDTHLINKVIETELPNWNYGLQGACQGGHRELAERMIACGATDMYYGLKGAGFGGHQDLVEWMLTKIHQYYKNSGLHAVLKYAAQGGQLDMVKWIFNNGYILNKYDANACDSLMSCTCRGGHTEIIEYMIEKGVDCWIEGFNGACIGGNVNIINWMMKLSGINTFPLSGLYHACVGGHKHIINMFIEKNVNNLDGGLQGACAGGQLDIAKWMIQLGSTDFVRGFNSACLSGHTKIAELMLEHGSIDKDRINDVYKAVGDDHREVKSWLISIGAENN